MQPPYLEVVQPEPFSQQSTVTKVIGNTDPDAVVSINGQPVAIKPDGSFVAEIDLPAVGLITLRVEAQDSQTRSAVIEVPVRVVPPVE